MAVPKYNEFFSPVLRALEDGQIKRALEIRKYALNYLNVSEEDRKQMLPSNTQRLVDNRATWAITYLCKANLIERVAKGKYKITNTGIQVLHEKKDHVELKDLYQFDSFRQFINTDTMSEEKKDLSKPSVLEDLQEGTPQDNLNASMEQINKELSANLLSEIMERSPAFFEKMVVQLLLKMGYGSALEDGFVTGCSGDEGIDGIIREDKLGFSSIYIQAKRWAEDKAIGRPEIQKFVGALAGQGAQKGLFITTGTFTKEARSYVEKQLSTKVVLVDGEKLTKLMIEYNIGVSVETVYTIKKIDTDFFSEEND
ncbi:MAG: restriction endonuclease [Eubacteriales bacterium]|nr:restriction endonuclease [Eubacteriales bacterium]